MLSFGPGFGPVYVKSTVVVTLLFLGLVWLGTIAAGADWQGGLAVGAMCAVWGGPGFGLLAACAIHLE